LGTRQALYEKGRQSLTLTISEVSPFTVGVLIALFERAVGFYASLVNINAYHQPGVEAGKKAAGEVLNLQQRVIGLLEDRARQGVSAGLTAEQIADGLAMPAEAEMVFKICEHLAGNSGSGILRSGQGNPATATYRRG
jgi:glucose-6-phosphate isomerase